jgi:hypothetical protein
MKRILQSSLFVIALTLLFSFSQGVRNVYICNSSSAKKYHYSSSCRGLNACKHEVIKVSKEDAQKSGRTLCGWED